MTRSEELLNEVLTEAELQQIRLQAERAADAKWNEFYDDRTPSQAEFRGWVQVEEAMIKKDIVSRAIRRGLSPNPLLDADDMPQPVESREMYPGHMGVSKDSIPGEAMVDAMIEKPCFIEGADQPDILSGDNAQLEPKDPNRRKDGTK